MAYMSQDKKKELAPAIRAICKKFGVQATLAVDNYSTLVLNIRKGRLDFFEKPSPHGDGYIQVNEHWLNDSYEGEVLDFLQEVKTAMNIGNHNNSDIMTDYFDVGWYVNINVGKWDKPYVLIK